MNSVISAFKTKKAASANSAGNVEKQPHGNCNSALSTHPNSNSMAKKKAVNAQDSGYQYLRHIREIETATKQLSPVVAVDDLLESDKLTFHATPPAADADVVDHAPALVAPNAIEIASAAQALAADVNMNDALNSNATHKLSASTPSKQHNALENGNCNDGPAKVAIDNCTTGSRTVPMTTTTPSSTSSPNADTVEPLLDVSSCSPIQHILLSSEANDDDDSEHSTTACTSSSSEHSNSTVVHSPSRTNISQVPQLVKTLPPPQSPTLHKQQQHTAASETPQAAPIAASTALSSLNCSTVLHADANTNGICDTSNTAAVPVTATTPNLPPLPIIKTTTVTLPIIMPNGNSNLVSMPPHNAATTTPINSAANTPKHARFSKPRLGLSRFMNHSMPSVHGRPNLTLTTGSNNPNDITSITNAPKRISTHQRNLSLDFRSMGILLPPVSQVTNTRINLTQHHRNRSLDSALQRIPEVEVSSPNAESENTFCTPSILGSTMCSKIVTTAASVTAAFTTTTTPALTSSTTAAEIESDSAPTSAAAVTTSAGSASPTTVVSAANQTLSKTVTVDVPVVRKLSPSTDLTSPSPSPSPTALSASLTPNNNLMLKQPAAAAATTTTTTIIATQHNKQAAQVKANNICSCARYRPKTTEITTTAATAATTAQCGGVSVVAKNQATAICANCQPNKINTNINASGNSSNSVTAAVTSTGSNKKREDLTSLGSDDSGIICGSEADQISLNRIRHSHESLDSGGMDADEECIDMLETTSMDEEYNLLQSDLCFYQTAEPDCRTLRPTRKKHGKDQKSHGDDANDNDSPDTDAKSVADDDLTERRRYREMNMSQAAIIMERSRSASSSLTLVAAPATAAASADNTPTLTSEATAADGLATPVPTPAPTPTSAATTPTSLNSTSAITPTNAKGPNDVLFKNFFGATKNAIFRTAQSIIDNHEKKNASKSQRSEDAIVATDQIKSPTDISKKKEFFGLITSHSSKKAAAAAAAAAASKQSTTTNISDTTIGDAKSANNAEKSLTDGSEKPSITPSATGNASITPIVNASAAGTSTLNVANATSILTKSASITSLNKLKVPGVVKCFIKERSNIGDLTQQKTEKGPSGLLRFFESPVFNIHFAVHYLFYSKEPGVLSFIGNKIFSFPDPEVDLYIPQLIVMYIQMDELAEVLDHYLTFRCRKSVDFSLKCLWLLEAYNYQVDSLGNNNTTRKSNLGLMKELFSKKERKVLNKLEDKQIPVPLASDAATLSIGITPMVKKTHHRSQSDATVLLADSRVSMSCVSISNRSYQQPPYTTQTLPLTPAKLCLGDLTSGRAFDNGCTCFESVRGQVNGLLGQKTVCVCGAPKTAPQKEFMKALINVGKNLTLLPSKAEKTSALRMFLNLINKNLPARVWLPLYSDIPHHVVRITEEKTAVLNSKDKTPYIIYVEVVEVPDIYSSPLIQKLMPTLRHTKSEEHLEGVCLGQMHHITCSRTSSCSSRGTSVGGNGASCRRKKDKPVSESSSSMASEQQPIATAAVAGAGDGSSPHAGNTIGAALAGLHFTEDDVWSQEDDEITAQYLNLRKVCERDALSQLSLDSCDSRDQGMPVLFNIGDVRTRHCNNLTCENTKSFSNDPEDPSAAALKEPWHEKEKQIRESSPYGHLSTWRLMSAIVKCGDDLRQELMATQLLQMFKIIWQEENVDLWVRPYKIVCLSNDSGLIEPILNTVSLHQIKKNSNKSLRDYFVDEYGQSDGVSFRAAQKNFVQSCAAYCLISYLLQVKDRHNGNILLHSDGHIIHIDFGFILSISPKNLGFEQSPFKLTHEFVDVMGGTQSEHWNEFNRLLLIGMMSARKHMDRIINFVEIMRSNAQLPCFKNGCSGTVQNLRKRFHMNLTEQEMERKVEQLVQDSLKSLSTKLYDGYQYYTNGIL